jgi:hypothetical protein
MGRDGRHDRSAFAHGGPPPHHLNCASFPLSPPTQPTPPPPTRPPPNDREVARPAGRSVDAAPLALPTLAPPASVGRNVYHAAAAAHALRASRRQPVGTLVHSVAGMRSNVLEPHRPAIAIGPHEPQGR